ncbi:NAD dependent epimerase/dehydratase [Mycena amicta]|nr:NAD dependent epimerase/dehydratase [Mycena amicta]
MPTFLVTTATGRQGTSTARILLAKGAQVNALVRNTTSVEALVLQQLGARLFKGGFTDVSAIEAAMQGVSGVFLNPFPDLTDPTAEQRAAETIIAAARSSGTVQTIVVSTVFGANFYSDWHTAEAEFPFLARYYGSKAAAEQAVRESGFQYTIVRPGWLMHNYIGGAVKYHFPEYPTARVLTVSYPRDFRLGHLDAADVGQVAAAVLLDPTGFAGREIDMENEALTMQEVAEHLSAALGAEVTVKYRTAEETTAAKKALPTVESQIWRRSPGRGGDTSELKKLGLQLTTFKEFLEREKVALRKTVMLE